MQKLLLLTSFIFSVYCIQAQTFVGNVGAIPGTSTTQTCFTNNVSGIGNISPTAIGLASVCINITHPNTDELEILLSAPDGTVVPLSIQNGGSGNNYINTCFTATASSSVKFANAPFNGNFLPEGYLGSVNNGQNADGTWSLCIQDRRTGANAGSLTSWSLLFNNTPAPLPPAIPACSTTLPGTSSCSNATAVCDFNGLCGNTTGNTVQDWPGSGLDGCFGLQNNSFIKFEAAASTVSFTVWVPTSSAGPGGGIQMIFFSGTCGSGAVTSYGCYPHIFPYQSAANPLPTIVSATGLTPGNIYYLMIDGFNNDKCTFSIAANTGINVLDITPSAPAICEGKSVNLVGSGGNGSYSWSPATGLNSTNTATVTASPVSNTTYTLTSTNSLGCSLTKDVTVTVNPAPVITTHPTSTIQNICQNAPIPALSVAATAGSGTISSYQWYISTTPSNTAGFALPFANSSTFTPSSAGTGTLYFYCKITNSGGCTTTSNISGAIIISPKVNAPVASATVQPTCLAPTGTIIVTSPFGVNFEYSIGGTYQSSATFTGLTSAVYNVTAKNIVTGCISVATPVTLNTLPAGPATPAGSVTVQPSCAIATGTIVITFPSGANIEYSVGGIYQSSGTFSGLTNGTVYSVTATDISTGCISTPLLLTVNTIPGAPAAPSASVTTQPDCNTANGTITITAPVGVSLEYSIGGAYQASGIFSGLTPGTNYAVTAKDILSGCVSPPTNLSVNTITATSPPAVTSPVGYCQNATAPALTAIGTSLLWYTAATGGTGTATAPTPSTATAVSIIYYVSQTTGTCESPRAAITVTISAQPAAPVITTPVPYCENEATTPLAATGASLLWYTTATGGTGSATAPTPSSTNTGNTIYYVSQTVSGCESPRAAITVTVNPIPAAPAVTTPVVNCQNITAAALSATGTSLLWYTNATGDTGSAIAPVPSTTTTGNKDYYVSQTISGCESPRAVITVIVNSIAATPAATTPVAYCENNVAAALTATGTNLLWYTTATGGSGNATAPTPSTTGQGSTLYYVSQTINGCESPRASITVTVNPNPAAPVIATPVVYCENETTFVLSATGTGLLWYSSATGGTGSATAPTPSSANAGNIIYYVSQTINGCESPRAAITVTVNPTPALPSVISPVVYCQNLVSTVLTAAGSNLLWYTAATGGTGTAIAPLPSTSSPGNRIYYVSQTINGCESQRAVITVTVNPTPALPSVITPVVYCQNLVSTVLTAAGSNLLWYTAATGGTGAAVAPVPSTAIPGNTNYYTTQTLLGCESPRAVITVTVNATPATPVVVSPVTYCQYNTASAVTATGSNLLWYNAATGGTDAATAPTPATTTPGNTFYYVSQTILGCEGPRSAITVTINKDSTAVTAFTYSPDTVCINGINPGPAYTLGFTTGGTFSSTSGLSVNAVNGSINLTSSTPGSYLVKYNFNTTGCIQGAITTIRITINPAVPTLTLFSYSSPVCKNDANPLPATIAGFTTGGTFSSSPGIVVKPLTGEIDLAASIPGSYLVTYSLPVLGCRLASNNFAFLNIVDTTRPVTKFSYTPGITCITAGSNPTLVKASGFAIGGTFSATPAGLNINSTTGAISIGLSTPGTYKIKYSVPKFLCRLADSDSTILTINSYGDPITDFSYFSPVCQGDTSATVVSETGFTMGGVFSSTAGLMINPNTGMVDLTLSTPGNYIINYSVAAGECNAAGSSTATLNILNQPEPPNVTPLSVCGPGDVLLSASSTGTIKWYTEQELINQVNVGNTLNTYLENNTRYYLTNTVGTCDSKPATLAAIVNPLPGKPFIGNDTAICTTDKLILNPGLYNNYLWQDGSTQQIFTANTAGNYKVVVSTGEGCTDSASLNITILDNCDDVYFPSAFSPDGNGLNDKFGPLGNLFIISDYSLRIFNRFGEIVFSTRNPYEKWDGTNKGKMLGTASFVYAASYTYKNRVTKTRKGSVMIVK